MEITQEQKDFIYYKEKDSIILAATAGSGKTYCCIQRLNELLKRKIDPKKMIFFSYTNAAVNELKDRIGDDKIKVTTIHSFCMSFLKRIKKNKNPVTFYEFLDWYEKNYAPTEENDKELFEKKMELLKDDSSYISSKISAYKLQSEDGIETEKPVYIEEYQEFLLKTESMDFSDMLIETRRLLRDNRYLRMIKNKYDYIFVDEYQDTSTIQMDILLSLNAKCYYIIGDVNQSIFSYSAANCTEVEEMLKRRRKTITMPLSVNFRSDTVIVENSNKYSKLQGIPSHEEPGKIDKRLIYINDIEDLIRTKREVVVLVRTNAIIREIEEEFMKRKVPIKYFNYIKPEEIEKYKKGEATRNTIKKLDEMKIFFKNDIDNIVKFISLSKKKYSFITTVHKAKGREFDVCAVVNSLSPEIVEKNQLKEKMSKELLDYYTFDPNNEKDFEAKNVHYVAISRPKHELYFTLYINKK